MKMAPRFLFCRLISYISILGFALGALPLLDKTEIGEGENFSIKCNVRRVTHWNYRYICYLIIGLRNPSRQINEDIVSVFLCGNPTGQRGGNKWPWKTIINEVKPKTEESEITLINLNSTCDNAGEYVCTFSLYGDTGRKNISETLSKKASCYWTTTTTTTTTTTSGLPTETSYSSVTDANYTRFTDPSHDPPTTRSDGRVNSPTKSFFIAETLLFIAASFV